MKHALIAMLLLGATAASASNPTGVPVPRITMVDETGSRVSLNEMEGLPVILVPMYTKCPDACLQVTKGLKQALLSSHIDVNRYRLILFSFDATDTPRNLAEFRQRERVPLGWRTVTASPQEITALMESIGFTYRTEQGQFVHPNLVVALDPDLRTAKYLYGTKFSAGQLEEALQIAMGRSDWKAKLLPWAFVLMVFASTVAAIVLTHLLMRRSAMRRRLEHATP